MNNSEELFAYRFCFIIFLVAFCAGALMIIFGLDQGVVLSIGIAGMGGILSLWYFKPKKNKSQSKVSDTFK